MNRSPSMSRAGLHRNRPRHVPARLPDLRPGPIGLLNLPPRRVRRLGPRPEAPKGLPAIVRPNSRPTEPARVRRPHVPVRADRPPRDGQHFQSPQSFQRPSQSQVSSFLNLPQQGQAGARHASPPAASQLPSGGQGPIKRSRLPAVRRSRLPAAAGRARHPAARPSAGPARRSRLKARAEIPRSKAGPLPGPAKATMPSWPAARDPGSRPQAAPKPAAPAASAAQPTARTRPFGPAVYPVPGTPPETRSPMSAADMPTRPAIGRAARSPRPATSGATRLRPLSAASPRAAPRGSAASRGFAVRAAPWSPPDAARPLSTASSSAAGPGPPSTAPTRAGAPSRPAGTAVIPAPGGRANGRSPPRPGPLGAGPRPAATAAARGEGAYYDYGGNVTYEDNTVYYGDQPVASAEQYYAEAGQLAEAGQTAQNEEWLPLGVFAVIAEPTQTQDRQGRPACREQGRRHSRQPPGFAGRQGYSGDWLGRQGDPGVALKIEGNTKLVVETGLYNLTNDEVPVLVHFGPDRP